MAAPESLVAYKALHDRLLAEKPDGATHDETACPICAMTDEPGGTTDDITEGGSMSTTYTEEELKAAVDAATLPLAARIKDLEASHQESEVEAAVAAAKAESDAKIAEVQAELDAKVIEAEAEKTRADGIVAWLDEQKTIAEQAAVAEARKAERLDAVKEVANFPAEYLEKNADRFAAMSDEDFDTAIDGFKAAIARTEEKGDGIPAKTALHAGLDTTTDNGKTTAVKALIGARRSGRVDLSSL
jgi:hypothetical protein